MEDDDKDKEEPEVQMLQVLSQENGNIYQVTQQIHQGQTRTAMLF